MSRNGARLNRSHFLTGSRPRERRVLLLFLVLMGLELLMTGCPPPIVRVPVPPENIIKSGQVTQDADLAFARKDYYAALIKYLEAGRLNPNSEFIFNKIGISYSQLKYYPEAIASFQRSIGLNPKYPYSYNNLGTVYFANDDKKNAEKYFKKAISTKANVASFHINLGTLYIEKKKLEKGLAEWRKGLAIDPMVMRRSEGISLAAAGGRSNTAEKNYMMARIFASMGDVELAVESLKQALNAGFTNIPALRSEKDFDPIRQDERFVKFMESAELLVRP